MIRDELLIVIVDVWSSRVMPLWNVQLFTISDPCCWMLTRPRFSTVRDTFMTPGLSDFVSTCQDKSPCTMIAALSPEFRTVVAVGVGVSVYPKLNRAEEYIRAPPSSWRYAPSATIKLTLWSVILTLQKIISPFKCEVFSDERDAWYDDLLRMRRGMLKNILVSWRFGHEK